MVDNLVDRREVVGADLVAEEEVVGPRCHSMKRKTRWVRQSVEDQCAGVVGRELCILDYGRECCDDGLSKP